MQIKFKTVEEYFSAIPGNARATFMELRKIIKNAAPGAKEVISYNMPALRFHRILVYYAAFTNHVSLFPGNSKLIELFRAELKDFETSKGTIRFPLGKALPSDLIQKIVIYRVKEQLL